MIRALGTPAEPVTRLLAALARRGHRLQPAAQVSPPVEPGPITVVLGLSEGPEAASLAVTRERLERLGSRLLVVSLLGTHPDARAPALRHLWELEERARAMPMPVLTLRIAPLVGPQSPLWLKLRSRPRLPRRGRKLLNPVAEVDVVETLDRALSGRAPWEGWYEIAGPETVSLGELARLAQERGPRLARDAGRWEPALELMDEQRLSDPGPWRSHFEIEPSSVSRLAPGWAA